MFYHLLHVIKSIIFTGLTTFLMLVVLCYFFQRQFIYFPDKSAPYPEQHGAEDMRVVSIKTSDHLLLRSWYKPARLKNGPTILFLHGNAGNISHRVSMIRRFLDQGYGVFLLEYRGYADNPGVPSEQGLYKDARAAFELMQQAGVRRLILYGESLGCAVAVQLATEKQVTAVILQTPFTSLKDEAKEHYPWLSFIPLMDKYASLDKIQQIHAPLLIIHGTEDSIVPYEQGQLLFEHALKPKSMITLAHRQHHDLWSDSTLAPQIFLFIQQVISGASK